MDPNLVRKQNGGQPLSPRQQKLVEGVGQGMSERAACNYAGLKFSGHYFKDPRIIAGIAEEKRKNAAAAELKRQDIIDGLKEAVLLSKQVSDPHALIKAWSELGRLCGFYAPEVRKLDISVTAKRVITQMEQLSEVELLQLANEELGEGFEGHFKRLTAPLKDVVDAEVVELKQK